MKMTSNKASIVWSEDVSRRGFRACVLVTEETSRHEDKNNTYSNVKNNNNTNNSNSPTVHWTVSRKDFYENDNKAMKVGSNDFEDISSNESRCIDIFDVSENTTFYSVFASVELYGKHTNQNAPIIWTDTSLRNSTTANGDLKTTFSICAKTLGKNEVLRSAVVVVN